MSINQAYYKEILGNIKSLLDEEKQYYKVDLHIHSDHSLDGKQTIDDILLRTQNEKFDIISITDHDSIKVYSDNNIKKFLHKETPIVIPGIEFTADWNEYGSMCHLLRYFWESSDIEFNNLIKKNENAFWNRAKIQFERIENNNALKNIFHKTNISCSYEDYIDFLKVEESFPDYMTLAEYLGNKIFSKGITVRHVLELLKKENQLDHCDVRRKKVEEYYMRFENKNRGYDIDFNARKLLTILAIVGVDDADYSQFSPFGSLTVNSFGQVNEWKVGENGFNIMAHPKKGKVQLLDKLSNNFYGAEINVYSSKEENILTNKYVKENRYIKTIGSDLHDNNDTSYLDGDFYMLERENLIRIYGIASRMILKEKGQRI